VEVLEKVLEWYVGDSEVRLYLGLAYSLQKNSQRAVEEMEKALQLDSGNYSAHYYLGIQYQSINSRKAKKHLQAFIAQAEVEGGNQKMIATAKNLLKKL
jgi:Tfp pilus assembly protein PilF